MASWISIAKPTSSVWSRTNPQGREQYDDSNLEYDDPNAFYDGINQAAWSNVAKPVSSTWTKIQKPT